MTKKNEEFDWNELFSKMLCSLIFVILMAFWTNRSLDYWGEKFYEVHFTYKASFMITGFFYPLIFGFNVGTEVYRSYSDEQLKELIIPVKQ